MNGAGRVGVRVAGALGALGAVEAQPWVLAKRAQRTCVAVTEVCEGMGLLTRSARAKAGLEVPGVAGTLLAVDADPVVEQRAWAAVVGHLGCGKPRDEEEKRARDERRRHRRGGSLTADTVVM